MEEDGSFEIWGRIKGRGRGGGEPLSWKGVFMSVVCRKVPRWARKFSTKYPIYG